MFHWALGYGRPAKAEGFAVLLSNILTGPRAYCGSSGAGAGIEEGSGGRIVGTAGGGAKCGTRVGELIK